MAKLARGRIDGLHGMRSFGAAELLARADEIEAQILHPENVDDPRWLRRWASNIRALAVQKEKAASSKARKSGSRAQQSIAADKRLI